MGCTPAMRGVLTRQKPAWTEGFPGGVFMNVLGIETSCDETAAAVVRDGRHVLSNVVLSQVLKHRPYGGVVPEIACRSHVEALPGLLEDAVRQAGLAWNQLDATAVTRGPGLSTSLLVGLSAAKALAFRLGKPLLGVNHLESHLYSLLLGVPDEEPASLFPMIVLTVSGGHTCLVLQTTAGDYRLLGQSLDDAAGEALDKGANLLRLGYPGGPEIEKAAAGGNPHQVRFPRGETSRHGNHRAGALDPELCFSFSGLKTALLYHLKNHPAALRDGSLPHVAASYQEAVFDALLIRVQRALERFPSHALGCVGGVARNRRLRDKLAALAQKEHVRLLMAPFEYCTDNAAMVAALAGSDPARAMVTDADFDVQPNLSLTER